MPACNASACVALTCAHMSTCTIKHIFILSRCCCWPLLLRLLQTQYYCQGSTNPGSVYATTQHKQTTKHLTKQKQRLAQLLLC
jgi:hypothetical protein